MCRMDICLHVLGTLLTTSDTDVATMKVRQLDEVQTSPKHVQVLLGRNTKQ